MGTFVFFYQVQPLAQNESDSGVEACSRPGGGEDGVWVGVGWRKEQEGAMISEGNDPIPPFCIHSLRPASVLLEAAAGERASGTRLAIAFWTPGLPAPTKACGKPPGGAAVGTWRLRARPGTRGTSPSRRP